MNKAVITKTLKGTKKGVQTVKVLLELGLISTTRTVVLKGKELDEAQLDKIAKKQYSSIGGMGGSVTVVGNTFEAVKKHK
jgi:hypothetical protein